MVNLVQLSIKLRLNNQTIEYHIDSEINIIKSAYEESSIVEETKTYGNERKYREISKDHPTGDPDY